MHGLALCSRVLYDQQILDDQKHIERLEKEIETWKKKSAVATFRGSHLYQSMRDCTIRCILHMLHHTKHEDSTLLEELLRECEVSYIFLEGATIPDPQHDVDIVLCISDEDASFTLGHSVWKKATLQEQAPVYYFLYVLSMLDYFEFEDMYHSAWDIDDTYSPGTFFYVLNLCQETRRRLPQTFEVYTMIH